MDQIARLMEEYGPSRAIVSAQLEYDPPAPPLAPEIRREMLAAIELVLAVLEALLVQQRNDGSLSDRWDRVLALFLVIDREAPRVQTLQRLLQHLPRYVGDRTRLDIVPIRHGRPIPRTVRTARSRLFVSRSLAAAARNHQWWHFLR